MAATVKPLMLLVNYQFATHRLLALDESAPVGYKEIRVEMDIKADCSDEELDELLAFAQDHSPACNTVCRPVPVTVERVR